MQFNTVPPFSFQEANFNISLIIPSTEQICANLSKEISDLKEKRDEMIQSLDLSDDKEHVQRTINNVSTLIQNLEANLENIKNPQAIPPLPENLNIKFPLFPPPKMPSTEQIYLNLSKEISDFKNQRDKMIQSLNLSDDKEHVQRTINNVSTLIQNLEANLENIKKSIPSTENLNME